VLALVEFHGEYEGGEIWGLHEGDWGGAWRDRDVADGLQDVFNNGAQCGGIISVRVRGNGVKLGEPI